MAVTNAVESSHPLEHQSLRDPGQFQTCDPLQTATGVYIVIHGHFYQPPRENPYINTVERQLSADPYHDWNERIYHECYRPNALARILNNQGEIVGIVNNYEYLSFNIGPTLMSWLERYDMQVYQRIIEADRISCQRLNGHGNAIAQVYNHIIMPLANERDKYTQIRWGKADFRSRFGRDPEGMWLAETAIDYATLEALINEGIRFTILAPSQAQRCRLFASEDIPDPEWIEVSEGQIDPTRPYRCYLKNEAGEKDTSRYLDIFFYDGPISADMGFDDVLSSSGHLAGRLSQAVHGDGRPSQVISVATDGETFGHHKGGTEKCLAYAFVEEFPRRGWTVTNFAHYLSLNSPTWEVELKPVTAWSCFHGVDRWQEDCGCGGGGVWHQKWRRPLRDSLNWLRDQLIEVYQTYGHQFFNDPWRVRDEYIQVICDRSSTNLEQFFSQNQTHLLTDLERIDGLRLLEMQRHSLLMFTSCGWFFEEISRPEGTQLLRYASRGIELATEVTGIDLEAEFLRRLALAPSNVELFKTGDEVYRQLVKTSQISFEQVAAHYAISSLFTTYTREQQIYCYNTQQLDYKIGHIGTLTLAVGRVQLTSEITREQMDFVFAVLHLGGWDFHCCLKPFAGRLVYNELKQQLFEALQQASAAQVILEMVKVFGEQSLSLQDLFAEERQRIMGLLSQETLARLNQLYTQVYRDNYGVIMAFHRDYIPVPQELQVAAEIALSHRCVTTVRALEAESSNGELSLNHLAALEAIATEANQLKCRIHQGEVGDALERLILRSLCIILQQNNPTTLEAEIESLERLIQLGYRLELNLSLAQAQELYLHFLGKTIVPLCLGWLQRQREASLSQIAVEPSSQSEVMVQTTVQSQWGVSQLRKLLQLGQTLTIDVQELLNQLV
jgi:alpha-amylase/alpha-mannosidase (GH57 family)